jgi:mannose-6-phosphate isomerase-like protein (cupin superfamily)
MIVSHVVLKRFDAPDEVREFPKGRFEVIRMDGVTVGRATYQPGWKWSEHVGREAGAKLCEVTHVGLVLRGRARVVMRDGTDVLLEPGDLFSISPGHDSWVEGSEEYVSLHFLGADEYARE